MSPQLRVSEDVTTALKCVGISRCLHNKILGGWRAIKTSTAPPEIYQHTPEHWNNCLENLSLLCVLPGTQAIARIILNFQD